MIFGNMVMPRTRHVRAGRDLLRRAFEAANKIGDLNFAAASRDQLNGNFLAAGDPLVEVQDAIEHSLEFAQKARFGFVADGRRLITTLTTGCGSVNCGCRGNSRLVRRSSSEKTAAGFQC
jgi:hypothetical protein